MSGYNATMNRRRLIRRVIKWVGLVFCVLIVVAWAVSLRWCVAYAGIDRGASVEYGFAVVIYPFTKPIVPTRWQVWGATPRARKDGNWGLTTEGVFRVPALGLGQGPGKNVFILLPLWIPLIVLAIPTAFLFYRDRRRIPPGHCQKCGYNLTGNVSGVCPECGKAI